MVGVATWSRLKDRAMVNYLALSVPAEEASILSLDEKPESIRKYLIEQEGHVESLALPREYRINTIRRL